VPRVAQDTLHSVPQRWDLLWCFVRLSPGICAVVCLETEQEPPGTHENSARFAHSSVGRLCAIRIRDVSGKGVRVPRSKSRKEEAVSELLTIRYAHSSPILTLRAALLGSPALHTARLLSRCEHPWLVAARLHLSFSRPPLGYSISARAEVAASPYWSTRNSCASPDRASASSRKTCLKRCENRLSPVKCFDLTFRALTVPNHPAACSRFRGACNPCTSRVRKSTAESASNIQMML
jgi:hypothetical protein